MPHTGLACILVLCRFWGFMCTQIFLEMKGKNIGQGKLWLRVDAA